MGNVAGANTLDKGHNHITLVKDMRGKKIAFVSSYTKAVKTENVPEYVYKNLQIIEDRNFLMHFGISIRGIGRAIWVCYMDHRFSQGGSTITQQLVRTKFPVKNKFLRKALEISLAPLFTLFIGRAKILDLYLSSVFFGQNISGITAASFLFFRKKAISLSRLESFVLFSVLSRPNYWLSHPISLKKKVKAVASRIDWHLGSDYEIDSIAKKMSKNSSILNHAPKWFPKFNSYIRKLNIESQSFTLAIDCDLQRAVHRKTAKIADNFLYAVIDYKKFKIRCVLDKIDGQNSLYPALFSKKIEVGSLLKPLLVLLAHRQGYDADHLVFDSKPIEIEFAGFPTWKVNNHNSRFLGPISLSVAITNSDNSVCVQALQFLGLENFKSILIEKKIIDSGVKVTPSIVLGACDSGFNLVELLRFYSEVASLKRHMGCMFDGEVRSIKDETKIPELVAVRRVLKSVVLGGTAQKLDSREILGAKTGTSGSYQNVIFFDRENLYVVLHKEKEQEILHEQYLNEVMKCYGVMDMAIAFWRETKKFIKATVKPDDLYGRNKWVA